MNSMDIDELQGKFGGISLYQILVIICVSTLPFGTSFMSQSAAFFSAVPRFRCFIPQLDNSTTFPRMTDEEISQLMTPKDDSCSRFNYNMSACTGNRNSSCLAFLTPTNETIACDHGFVYDNTYYERTTVSEWDLVCNRMTLDSVAISLYFVGILLGSAILGPLTDWFGRKITMILTGSGVVVSGMAVAFSPSYEVYIAMRVLVAMTSVPCYVVYSTYVNEMSDTKWRFVAMTYAHLVSAMSHTVLPVLGMLIRDWRYLGICLSLFPVPALILFVFIPESPRWLMGKGRFDEARKVVQKYAASHKMILQESDWVMVVKSEREKVNEARLQTKYNILDLFRLPAMRIVSINIMYLWCTISMVYYGLVLNVWRLSGHPHINGILNASVEIIGICVLCATLRSIGMKLSCSLSILFAGISCLTTMLLNQFSYGNGAMIEAARWIAIVGKFFASISYTVIYQYTTELYPTLCRGTAMSMGSMSARIGAIVLPYTLQLQASVPWLTQTIFGVMGIVGGLSSLLLPETAKIHLLSTFEEAENFYRKEAAISSLLGKHRLVYNERSLPLGSVGKGEPIEFHHSHSQSKNSPVGRDDAIA